MSCAIKTSVTYRFTAKQVRLILKFVDKCRGDSSRYALAVTRFEFNGSALTVVATNGRHLAVAEVESVTDSTESYEFNLSLLGLRKQRLNTSDGDVELTLSLTDNGTVKAVLFSWESSKKAQRSAVCQVLDGRFPNWRQVMPKESLSLGTFSFVPSRWADEWKNRHSKVELTAEGDSLTLRPSSMPCFHYKDMTGEPMVTCLDMDMLGPQLSAFGKDVKAKLSHYGANSPIKITSGSLTYIIMPCAIDR